MIQCMQQCDYSLKFHCWSYDLSLAPLLHRHKQQMRHIHRNSLSQAHSTFLDNTCVFKN